MCQVHPVLVKKANQVCGSFLLKFFVPGLVSCLVVSCRFVGDPASLSCDKTSYRLLNKLYGIELNSK